MTVPNHLYFYGIIPTVNALPSIEGVDGEHSLFGIVHDRLCAVVSQVDPAQFATDEAEDGANLVQLTGLVLQHERVITSLMQNGSVLPAPFGTLLQDEDSIHNLLQTDYSQWMTLMQQVDGCVEVGLKAFVNDDLLLQSQLPDDSTETNTSGMNYMLRKKAEMNAKKSAERLINDKITTIHEHCVANSREHVVKSIQSNTKDEQGRLVMRTIYLLPQDQVTPFIEALNTFDIAWLTLAIDGPFAPYHFAGTLTA